VKLSIITVNLNNDEGLERTLKSIFDQSFSDFESIVIDGLSDDRSVEIIELYKDKINYWVSEKDFGIYNAMNKGIHKAKAEYCLFLNSGDFFIDENVLSKVFNHKFTEDFIFGNLKVFVGDKIVGTHKGLDDISFLDLYLGKIKHQSSLIKKELFDKFGHYNEELKIIADWEFFLKTLLIEKASYKHLDIDISYFDNEGISNHNAKLVHEERDLILKKHIPEMILQDYSGFEKQNPYLRLHNYKISRFIMRLMLKFLKTFSL